MSESWGREGWGGVGGLQEEEEEEEGLEEEMASRGATPLLSPPHSLISLSGHRAKKKLLGCAGKEEKGVHSIIESWKQARKQEEEAGGGEKTSLVKPLTTRKKEFFLCLPDGQYACP